MTAATKCLKSGWGLISSDHRDLSEVLQVAELKVEDRQRREEMWADRNPVFEGEICTANKEGKSSCKVSTVGSFQ